MLNFFVFSAPESIADLRASAEKLDHMARTARTSWEREHYAIEASEAWDEFNEACEAKEADSYDDF